MNVVLDTNVVVSALLFERGRLAWIRGLWLEGRVVPLVSRPTVEELIRVLAYPKFRLSAEDVESLIAAYLPYSLTVAAGPSKRSLPKCEDPDDQPFLDLASAGKADVLISGDRAVLALAGRMAFAIESPEPFRERFPSAQ